MPTSYDSLRLRHQKAMDEKLTRAHKQLAERIALEVMRAAGQDGLIPPSVQAREALRKAIWENAIKLFYLGNGADALIGPAPQSPFAALLVEGIAGATRIQAERQAALVRRVAPPDVAEWLLGTTPSGLLRAPASGLLSGQVAGIAFNPTTSTLASLRGLDGRIDADRARAALVRPRGQYDSFHEWVDPRGYRLSDRIWQTSIEVRARIDHLFAYHLAQGTSAVDIAKLMEPFLTPGGRLSKTQTPYGTEGSFSARRLSRTEWSRASGAATINAAAANPFVDSIQWRLSGSHPRIDICDQYAHGGENGDGIYPIAQVPVYPPHPHCCTPGQLVQTERGAIPIEQVKEGDKVLTHMGRYRRVSDAWATPHDGQVYAFVTECGTFELTGNHPVLTRRGWVNADAVELGDEVLHAGVNVMPEDPYRNIKTIRLGHYTGPVYNMEVADDHSYTVNGAAVHNCLCSLLPVPTGSTEDLVSSLRADIQAARGNLLDAVSAGNPERGQRLRGLLNPERMTRALLEGNLDTTIADAVRQSAQRLPVNVRARPVRVVAPPVVVKQRREAPVFGSVPDAEAYARDVLGVKADYGGGTVAQANAINQGVADAQFIYSGPASRPGYIRFDDTLTSVGRQDLNGIRLNPKLFTDDVMEQNNVTNTVADLEKKIQRIQRKIDAASENIGIYTPEQVDFFRSQIVEFDKEIAAGGQTPWTYSKNMREVVVHEIGHGIEGDLGQGVFPKVTDFLPPSELRARGLQFDKQLAARLDAISQRDGYKLGEYAKKNSQEYFAESFVAFTKKDYDKIHPDLLAIFRSITE